MSELKLHDFEEMLNTSTEIGKGILASNEISVQIEDEEGDLYHIVDLKFNLVTRSIHITFNHDN